jgi:uncharacterized protein (DUF305 family)
MKGKSKILSPELWLIVAIIIGTAVSLLVSTQAKEAEQISTTATTEKQENVTEEKMHKCTNMCVQKCETNMKDISEARAVIQNAIEAIDKSDTKAARTEMEKADKLLMSVYKSMEENIDKMPCVNERCPISGNTIDMMNTPKDCTRMYKGMKVGFCCPNCPPEWDKLTDAKKEAKLKASMPSK